MEVGTQTESRAMSTLRNINGIEITVSVNDSFNDNKGLVYIQGYDMNDFDIYKNGLIAQYGLANVEEAIWIKSRTNTFRPLLLSFRKISELH